ncbi:MAG: hypothetical protein JGK30_03220 [Microcoleus sp. PH2017_40_RAT_O_B]|uniref:hypothetical protein n=1 Tax=unclassified Microcoleus TaxID=2642155 RepID=UPI001DB961A1|nr:MULTISPECIES: hypothetical protein [unclassified Microcoleus]MCC3565890.1 hypothetical protein [Microcoleus sp. PH2017_31_RDM_U_A]MCC3570195.1 hypothetical protein [Microcoleus sp. PH2017_34_RAT_O_A]MCC3578154.1 hypothetical protein [Microcoleus sp. PH2017_32_RDM_D_A]MCC3608534.1 hypothetical protein [Microcoleus sp. PH2017_40_RAT_O_B]MCC3616167.1 hypothetical protein [Microcoleus sp. PH2017_38_RDM_U_B]
MPLNLRIQSHKTIALIFIASLLINVFAIESTYSQQSCPKVQTSIQIIDETGGRQISGTSSVDTLQESHFKNYVTTISKHISAKIDEISQCHGDLKSSPEVKLFFVYRRLVKTAPLAPFNLERTESNGTRYLDSPWVKLTFSRSPRLVVRAVFLWSERQFLFDQALMSGIRASPTNPLLPIDEPIFKQFAQDYTDSVLLAPSPEAQPAALASISKRLPPEIFWLFRNTWQTTLIPFYMSVARAFELAVGKAAIGYTDLTKALVDQFFASEATEIRYESLLDLKDLFTPDRYRINDLLR